MSDYTLKQLKCLFVLATCLAMVGCRNYGPQDLIPASEVLNKSCCQPGEEQQINFLKLRRNPPAEYVVGKGDILGIYIQGITGDSDVPPPVNFGDDDGGKPALGYPVPVRDDGYVSLPLVAPIRVTGLTVGEAEQKIIRAYTQDKKILLQGNEKIIVTLMKRRTYNMLVIREDGSSGSTRNSLNRNEVFLDDSTSSESFSIELAAYENDVLHALSETGGMPGERAKNEIVVIRGALNGGADPNAIVQAVGTTASDSVSDTLEGANVVRIPIRGTAGAFPKLGEADITLEDGDVVYIEGRKRDVFYTGGLLDGGRYPLPRDYDIDVLEAMALAGGSVSATAGSGGGGPFRGIGSLAPATQVTVLRKCGCEQVAIDVDLRYALSDPCERVIIQPGDLIILEYRKNELITNTITSVFQFGGIFNLFR